MFIDITSLMIFLRINPHSDLNEEFVSLYLKIALDPKNKYLNLIGRLSIGEKEILKNSVQKIFFKILKNHKILFYREIILNIPNFFIVNDFLGGFTLSNDNSVDLINSLISRIPNRYFDINSSFQRLKDEDLEFILININIILLRKEDEISILKQLIIFTSLIYEEKNLIFKIGSFSEGAFRFERENEISEFLVSKIDSAIRTSNYKDLYFFKSIDGFFYFYFKDFRRFYRVFNILKEFSSLNENEIDKRNVFQKFIQFNNLKLIFGPVLFSNIRPEKYQDIRKMLLNGFIGNVILFSSNYFKKCDQEQFKSMYFVLNQKIEKLKNDLSIIYDKNMVERAFIHIDENGFKQVEEFFSTLLKRNVEDDLGFCILNLLKYFIESFPELQNIMI